MANSIKTIWLDLDSMAYVILIEAYGTELGPVGAIVVFDVPPGVMKFQRIA